MPAETKFKINADIGEVQKAFREVLKSQQKLASFQSQLNRKDPLSKKSFKDSQKALGEWQKTLDKATVAMRNNNIVYDAAIKKREKLIQLNKELGKSQARNNEIDRLSGIINKRRGSKSLEAEVDRTDIMAGNVASRAQAPGNGAYGSLMAGANAWLIAKMGQMFIGAIKQGAAEGWRSVKTTRDYALLTGIGELGGVDPKTNKPYGRYSAETEINMRKDQIRTDAFLKRIGFKNPGEVRAQQTNEYRQAMDLQLDRNPETIASTIALEKMGVSGGTLKGLGRGIMAGTANPMGQDRLTPLMQQSFANAMTLGFSAVRTGEFFNSIKDLQEAAQETADNTNPDDFRKSMDVVNAAGYNSQSSSLLAGRGGNFALTMQRNMMNPGGGVAGKLMMMKALGFKGNIIDYMVKQQKGLTPEAALAFQRMAGTDQGALMLSQMLSTPLAPTLAFGQGGKRTRGGAFREAKQLWSAPASMEAMEGQVKGRIGQSQAATLAGDIDLLTGNFKDAISVVVQGLSTLGGALTNFNRGYGFGINSQGHFVDQQWINVGGSLRASVAEEKP